MKVLVTGYKGYIGGAFYNKIKRTHHDVFGIDLKDGENIIDCLPKTEFDYVFHFAALPRVGYSVKNPSYCFKQNAYATSVLLEWAKNRNVKRVIFSSSSAVVGDSSGPNSPYGLHKLISEEECRLYSKIYDLDTVCLRYFNVFSENQNYGGSYSTVVCAWMEMIKKQLPLRIDGDGTQTRDYIHVDDIVDANMFCMNYKNDFNGDFYDVGTGNSISLNDIKKIVSKYHDASWQYAPERKGDVKHTSSNINKLKKLGWCSKINSLDRIENIFKEIKND